MGSTTDRRNAEWTLEWDDATLTLYTPDGQRALETSRAEAHRLIELYELYVEDKVSFPTSYGSLVFKRQPAAVAAVRRMVEVGMAGDPEFCTDLRRESVVTIPIGLAMFVVGGGLVGLYGWYASWAPDPPPGHWIFWFGWLIHLVLAVLMAVGFAGPFVAYFGLRQWLRVRRIEHLAAKAQRHIESGARADGTGR